MRKQFASLLKQLEDGHRRIELQINERYSRFRMPRSCVVDHLEEFQDIIARFYWHLYCPELDIGKHWNEHHESVASMAFLLLEREYGKNARFRACDLARTGAEAGLLGVLKNLMKSTLEDLYERHSKSLVDEYWERTGTEQILQDGRDYIQAYARQLPAEMTEGSGAVILFNLRKVLMEHPAMIRQMRQVVRR